MPPRKMSIRSTPLAAFAEPTARQGGKALKGEVDPAAGHAEIAVASANKVPAEIVHPADVARETHLHAATYLAHESRITIRDNRSIKIGPLVVINKRGSFATAEDSAGSAENIRSETAAMKRISKRQRSQNTARSS